MSSASRSMKRRSARAAGILVPRGSAARRQRQAASRMRRLWCPKCEKVVDDELGIRTVGAAPGSRKIVCAACGAAFELKRYDELPEGTPRRGLWVSESESPPAPVAREPEPMEEE